MQAGPPRVLISAAVPLLFLGPATLPVSAQTAPAATARAWTAVPT